MRTTLNLRQDLVEQDLRQDLVEQVMVLTRITEKTALIHAGLEALIAAEAGKRLARLGGSDRKATAGRRQRA